MKKALISPNQPCMSFDDPPIKLGSYVVEVSDAEFPVAKPLFWVECPDEIISYQYFWNEGSFSPVPTYEPTPVEGTNGPTVI